MSKLVESLVSAICALPLEEKRIAINQLLSDPEFRVAISNLLLEKIGGTSYNTPNSTTHVTVDKTNNHREIDKIGGTKQDNPQSLPNIADEGRNSRRERGIEQREKYISQLKNKGIPINYIGNVWAKTNKNTWVAIPYASERQPNRWFLGIGETDLSNKKQNGSVVIVLLCRSNSGEIMDFVLPTASVEKIIPYLSKSKGQYKFNVRKERTTYQLSIPGKGPQDITDCKGQTALLIK